MKDKEKQIEEMGKDVCNNINTKMCADGTCPKHWDCPYSNTMAEILIEKGYQKVDKDRITLTKEQYIDLTLAKQSIFNMLEERDNKARKETAREILKELLFVESVEGWQENEQLVEFGNKIVDKIEELAKQYGIEIRVEIKE